MNFSSGAKGEQGGRGPVPRLPSGDARGESPNKPIKPKITSNTKIRPSKSFRQRLSQREDEHIGSKIRGDTATSSSPSKEDTDDLGIERSSLPKPRSRQLASSLLRKSSAGLKSNVSSNNATRSSFEKNDLTNTSSLEKDPDLANEDPKKTSRRYTTEQRRANSWDGVNSDDAVGRDSKSPRTRRTKSEDDVAEIARRSLRSSGGRRLTRVDNRQRRVPLRSSRNLAMRVILSSESAKRREDIVVRSKSVDGAEGTDYHQFEESSRSYVPSPERSATGNSVAKILRSYSSGDFSGRSLDTGGDLSLARSNLKGERDLPLVDVVPSALRTPDDKYRRQPVGLPTFLFDPKNTDRTGRNKTPFSSRVMESTSSDSSDQRLARNDEADVRFQATLPSCPSVSTNLGDSCVVLFDGAPNMPQRTSDREYDDKDDKILESPAESKYKTKPSSPMANISFLPNEDHDEESSISIESLEDDSLGSFCPSISECISTGTSMADEAPKMPERGLSQLSVESGSALGALDDDISIHELRSGRND